METEGPPRLLSRVVGGRRLVLVPQSPRGTPRSVQDATSEDEEVVPGALRSRNDQNFERELVSESLRPDPVPVDPDIPDSHDRRLSQPCSWNVSELNSGRSTRVRARVHSKRLGGNGWCRFAGRISLEGTVFARCPQFLEGPVQVRFGHQFGGHEVCVPIW